MPDDRKKPMSIREWIKTQKDNMITKKDGGWYYLCPGLVRKEGPFRTRDEAEQAFNKEWCF